MSSLFQMKKSLLCLLALVILMTTGLWAQLPEGFESGAIPATWTVYNVDGDAKQFVAYNAGTGATGAQEGTWVAQVGYNAAGNDDWLISPALNITAANKVIKYWARSTSTLWFEDYNLKLSTTGNQVADFTVNLNSYTDIPNAWTEYVVDLTAYVGQTVYLGIQVVSVDELTFRTDGFDWVLGNDLAALSISGTNTPTVGQATPYTVNVKNNGGNAQTDYSVKLYVNDVEFATLPGTTIAAGETLPFNFTWTPAAVQNYTLYGKVVMTGDGNAANDQTANLAIVVQPSGTIVVTVGDPASGTSSNSYPANFYWKNSLSQTIYMATEMNAGGAITSMKYYANLYGDIPADRPLKIWMTNTTVSAFEGTAGWIPQDQFTLVFDGTVNLTASGAYELTIPFDVPFAYGGGNLAVMVYRPMDDAYYNSANVWKNTATAAYPNRTIYYASDTVVADPAAPPAGTLAAAVPNTSFVLNTAGFATLNGVVTSNSVPVEGARVAVNGTPRFALTNATGQYEIPYLTPATVTLTTTKHGYIDATTANVVLSADQTTTQNIAITQLPTVNVTGQINASDTAAGLGECLVKLEGYENYEVTANATGAFSFTGVYANQTYTIKITHPGYQAYNGTVAVAATNVVVPTVTLNELANPPSGVVATTTNTEANLSWNAPGDGVDVWFTHALMEEYSDAIGTGGAAEFIVAHRYSQAQLETFGVAGATLSKVKFMPAVAEATYMIKIYTGGNATDAGTLVLEQAVPSVEIETWNEIELTEGVTIPSDGELWIGYSVNTPSGYPAGCDAGPQLEGFGNMMYWQGAWTTLTALAPSLTYNWMIKGLATGATGPTYFGNDVVAPVAHVSNPARKITERSVFSSASLNGVLPTGNRSAVETTPVVAQNNDRALMHYNIWRTPLDTMNNPDSWTSIATQITTTNYIDPTWAAVTTGQFKYVVKAVYTGGVLSNPAFSNTVFKNMTSNVTINLATQNAQSPAGAVVTLTNIDGNPAHIYTATATSATVNFPQVWLGTYQIRVAKTGYTTVVQDGVVINTDTYNHPLITLPVSAIFFAEGFESGTFPPAGWTMNDADGDGNNWAVFTNDDTNVYAYEGENCAKSDSYINNVGALTPDNYLISSAINLPAGHDYTLKWYVAAQDPDWAAENYSVMVSTTNTQPASFTTVFTEVLQSGEYEERQQDLSDYAGQNIYLAYRHHDVTDMFAMKIDAIEILQTTATDPIPPVTKKTALKGNYPNPFNPETSIAFDLAQDANVAIEIFNVKGQKVRTLINDRLNAGSHSIVWNGTDDNGKNVSSGIYFFNMKSGKYTSTRKMILMK